MRFQFGPVPSSPDFVPDEQWKSLREPSPWLAQLLGLPVGIVAAGVIGLLWFTVTPLGRISGEPNPLLLLASLCGVAIVHELLHAAVTPAAGLSSRTIIGFWPSRLAFYAHYDGELSRTRFIAIMLMPFLVISVLPLVIAAIVQCTTFWLAFISTLNALFACVDLLGTGFVLAQIPANATIRNQGWRTYWRSQR